MPKYSVYGSATGTAGSTIVYGVNSATAPTRLKLYEVIIGSQATPADQAVEYNIRRVTDEKTTGSGNSVTPVRLDLDDRTANMTAQEAPTDPEADDSDPTYESGQVLEIALNQRATFRWIAAPGSELVADAAEDNGFGLDVAATTSAHSANATLLFEE